MTSLAFVLLSGTLSFGVPVAFAVRELMTLPDLRHGGDEPPPEPGVPRAPKPLPDCLQPETLLAREVHRTRVVEDA